MAVVRSAILEASLPRFGDGRSTSSASGQVDASSAGRRPRTLEMGEAFPNVSWRHSEPLWRSCSGSWGRVRGISALFFALSPAPPSRCARSTLDCGRPPMPKPLKEKTGTGRRRAECRSWG